MVNGPFTVHMGNPKAAFHMHIRFQQGIQGIHGEIYEAEAAASAFSVALKPRPSLSLGIVLLGRFQSGSWK